jgi:hypothetical protein
MTASSNGIAIDKVCFFSVVGIGMVDQNILNLNLFLIRIVCFRKFRCQDFEVGFEYLKFRYLKDLRFQAFRYLRFQGFEVSRFPRIKVLKFWLFNLSKFQEFKVSRFWEINQWINQFKHQDLRFSKFLGFEVLTFQVYEFLRNHGFFWGFWISIFHGFRIFQEVLDFKK